MNTKKRHEGYMIVDHRNSPGISEEFAAEIRRSLGDDALIVGAGQTVEVKTYTCSHCQCAVIINPQRTRPHNYCPKCDHYICHKIGCNVQCLPMNKVLDELQEQRLKEKG